MNKFYALISLLLLAFSLNAQNASKDKKAKMWNSERKYLQYQKEKAYKGPEEWYADEPSSLDEKVEETDYDPIGIQYDPKQIEKDRLQKEKGQEKSGGDGIYKPEIEKPEPIEFPDLDAPDIDAPNVDLDPPMIPVVFWKVLGFLLLFVVILTIGYYAFKNKRPIDKKVRLQNFQDDWTPETITKTELEILLERAMTTADYRECVRIYFTFILKELIQKEWIHWKPEKTNLDFIIEMKNKPTSFRFEECVRIYELIWYGDYTIDKEIFESIQPILEQYYQDLQAVSKGTKEQK